LGIKPSVHFEFEAKSTPIYLLFDYKALEDEAAILGTRGAEPKITL
jgi:hypothetical protein